MRRRATTLGLTATAAAVVWAAPAFAAFGDPDLTWGSGGVAVVNIAGVSSEGATALSGDAAGGANAFGPGRDNLGLVDTAALWRDDGRTVTTRTQRLNLGSFGQSEGSVSVARQPDGKFVTTGAVRGLFLPTVQVSRWNANGTLDTSFSADGTTFFPFPSGVSGLRPTAVVVQDDGKIVSVATSTTEPAKIAVGRLTANGQGDTSLGGSGSFALADNERAGGVATDVDTIYVGGDARLSDGRSGFVLYRLRKADGSLPSRTFAEVTAPEGGTVRATHVLRLADGRVVLAGGLENGTRGLSQGVLAAFQKSGTVDVGFGDDGLVLDKALTTDFRFTTAFGRIFGLTRTADGYALTAYRNGAGDIDFSWGGTGLVTGRHPSTVGKATSIAVTTRSGQAKLVVGGFDGSGTGSSFFAARFQLGCMNIRACTVGVQTSGGSATFTQTNTVAQFNGILVDRVLRVRRIAGRRVPVTRRVGRVPFGSQRKGRIQIAWDYKVNGKRLPAGTYRITMRTLRRGKVVELARPLIVKVPSPRRRAGGTPLRAINTSSSRFAAAMSSLRRVSASCTSTINSEQASRPPSGSSRYATSNRDRWRHRRESEPRPADQSGVSPPAGRS